MNDSSTPARRRPPFYKRNYLPLPGFQLRMILIAVALSLFQTVALIFCLDRFVEGLEDKLKAAQIGPDHPLAIFFTGQMQRLEHMTWIVSAVLVLLNMIVFLFVTHRIAGPIFRMRKTVLAWRRKDWVEIRLRKGDFFHELADEMDGLRKDLKS